MTLICLVPIKVAFITLTSCIINLGSELPGPNGDNKDKTKKVFLLGEGTKITL